MAVGLALSNWEGVENVMAMLFASITDMPFKFAVRIYSFLPSSASKQHIIRAAGKARFGDERAYMALFSVMLRMTEDFLARRNNIAHGIVAERDNGYMLTAPYHIGKNYDYLAGQEQYAFTSTHINQYASYFGHLQTEMMETMALLCFPFQHRALPETPVTRFLQPSLKNLRKLRIQGSEPPPLPPSP